MNLKLAVSFFSGLVIGGVGTYFILAKRLNKKYADRADEEIKSVSEFYKRKKEDISNDKINSLREKPDIRTYRNVIEQEEYAYGIDQHPISEKEPYLIDPDSFGEFDSYDTISMTYYNDGFLVDDVSNSPVSADETITIEALDHFGDPKYGYEEEEIYVRNEKLKIDYEITRTDSKYSDEIEYLNSLHGLED